jgi:hypothetical protein
VRHLLANREVQRLVDGYKEGRILLVYVHLRIPMHEAVLQNR